MKFYIDTNDWWIGYYRGPNHHYVCPLPTTVIRWTRDDEEEMDVNIYLAIGLIVFAWFVGWLMGQRSITHWGWQ